MYEWNPTKLFLSDIYSLVGRLHRPTSTYRSTVLRTRFTESVCDKKQILKNLIIFNLWVSSKYSTEKNILEFALIL